MTKKSSTIRLPFGEKMATRHAELMSRIFPGLNGYEVLETPSGFFSKTMTLAFPSISIVATAMSASLVDRDGRQHLTLMLPLVGRFSGTMAGKILEWEAGREGVLMPDHEGRVIGTGGDRAAVMLRLDAQTLERTAHIMSGQVGRRVGLRLDEFRTIPLQLHGRPLEPILRQMGKLVDAMECDVNALALQGYEDAFNRLAVGLIHPELFTEKGPSIREAPSLRAKVVSRLCDEMLANLAKKITLTELEQKSGYSARALQYAFRHRFGCSPMEWLREQRLQAARQRLFAGDFLTVAQLAHDLGFGTPSQFCTAYKRRFGESPVQSVK